MQEDHLSSAVTAVWQRDRRSALPSSSSSALSSAAAVEVRARSVSPEGSAPPLPRTDDGQFMVGDSPAMKSVFERIRRIARTDAPIMITGESGTGKELAAGAIHERSSRGSCPFVAINCAALPVNLIASELFGYEKGAFTGAYARKIGQIEMASGGTLFLDEIGDLPLDLQGYLLRFLQERKIVRVGGHNPINIDARIIAATNTDLPKAVACGLFREDLFYRLNVLTLLMPPLRVRGGDIELMAAFFAVLRLNLVATSLPFRPMLFGRSGHIVGQETYAK